MSELAKSTIDIFGQLTKRISHSQLISESHCVLDVLQAQRSAEDNILMVIGSDHTARVADNLWARRLAGRDRLGDGRHVKARALRYRQAFGC